MSISLKNNEQILREKIDDLENKLSNSKQNEQNLQQYIQDLEQALKIAKQDSEKYKPQSEIRPLSQHHDNKTSYIMEQLRDHTYYLLRNYCQGKTILDLGCGTGYGCALLAGFGAEQVTGIDLNVSFIQAAQNQYHHLKNVFFDVANAEQIGSFFENKKFDLIVMHHALEHLIDKTQCLTQLKKLLKPNGACIISCLNHTDLSTPISTLANYHSSTFIQEAKHIFGETIQTYYSYPNFGFSHLSTENRQYHGTQDVYINQTTTPFDTQSHLACTVIYDPTQKILPGTHLILLDTQTWQNMTAHAINLDLKKDRQIFELQQRALLAQAVIIENQLLHQKLAEQKQIKYQSKRIALRFIDYFKKNKKKDK